MIAAGRCDTAFFRTVQGHADPPLLNQHPADIRLVEAEIGLMVLF